MQHFFEIISRLTWPQIKIVFKAAGGGPVALSVVAMSSMVSLATSTGNVQPDKDCVRSMTCNGVKVLIVHHICRSYQSSVPSKSFSVYWRVLPGSFGASSSFGSIVQSQILIRSGLKNAENYFFNNFTNGTLHPPPDQNSLPTPSATLANLHNKINFPPKSGQYYRTVCPLHRLINGVVGI